MPDCAYHALLLPVAPPYVNLQNNSERVNSLDFHRSEDLLVTSSDDDLLHIYNTASGTLQEKLSSKKYGCHSAVFTHHSASILHASNKVKGNSVRSERGMGCDGGGCTGGWVGGAPGDWRMGLRGG